MAVTEEETIAALRARAAELVAERDRERQRADRWMSRARALDEALRARDDETWLQRMQERWEACHEGYMIR